MTMNIKKILRTSLLSLAVLGMVGGSLNGTANARRRYHYRSHRAYRHKRYGYRYYHRNFSNKYSRYCRYYHTGYFIYGKGPEWVRYRSGYYDHYWHWHSYKVSHRSSKSHNASAHKRSRFNPYKDGETASQRNDDEVFYSTDYNPVLKKYFEQHHSYKTHAQEKAEQVQNNAAKQETIQQNLAEMKSQTLKDINTDRQSHGVAPLSESPELDQIAGMRAEQDRLCQGHIDVATGKSYRDEDAQKLGYNHLIDSMGENLAANYGNNGTETANNAEDDLMNHDADSNWGHRNNILSPHYTQIGVGTSTATGQYKGDYIIAEDFTGPEYLH